MAKSVIFNMAAAAILDFEKFNFCLSNAAMQCIGQTYKITLGMVSVVDVDVDADVDVRQCLHGNRQIYKIISKSCSPIDMKFKHRLPTMKETSWVVQGSKISIQDGGSWIFGQILITQPYIELQL